jgi:ribose 5-phosphate isomerase B
MCGSGIGMSIVANKFPGIRAGLCWSETIAQLIAEHNAANIICLGTRFATAPEMILWIDRWLATPLTVELRHQKRIDKIKALETNCAIK